MRDRTDNYRGGVRFEFKLFHITLEQGGTTFKDDDAANYTGSNPGDSTVPILGQTLGLNSLQQAYGIRGSSVYSKVLFTSTRSPGWTFTASSCTASRRWMFTIAPSPAAIS